MERWFHTVVGDSKRGEGWRLQKGQKMQWEGEGEEVVMRKDDEEGMGNVKGTKHDPFAFS